MASQRQPRTRVDSDGVRTTKAPGVRVGVWLVVVAVLVAGVVLFLRRAQPVEDRGDEWKVAAPVRQDRGTTAKRAERVSHLPAAPRELPPRADLKETAQLPDVDTESGSAVDESEEEEPTGIALFPPPGTDPLKRGIVVPDDFELPPGFMRHYQVTDDGKPLRAILMFHPDYQPVDASGAPIPLPEDRVVPPEMAPPDLPIETLDDPEPVVPFVEERDNSKP